jgi:hypothetical protein
MTKTSTLIAKYMSEIIEEHASEDFTLLWSDEMKEKFIKHVDKLLPKGEKKVTKDKDAPKGPRNTFILYCSDKRSEVKAEFPDLKPAEITKVIADRWKVDKQNSKIMAYYQDLADKDKMRASEDKKVYSPKKETVKETDKKPTKAPAKKPVKRTKSAYQLFSADERAVVKKEGFSGKDITVELRNRWKNLDQNDKDMYDEYIELAADLRKQKVDESSDDSSTDDDDDE